MTQGPGAGLERQAQPPVVPRWEWRTFGESFGEADTHLAALAPDRVQESDEVYLLSRASDASVKVRDGLMDVKRLERVNDDGLEQWKPVMKASYPLARAGRRRGARGARRRRPRARARRVHVRRARRRGGAGRATT